MKPTKDILRILSASLSNRELFSRREQDLDYLRDKAIEAIGQYKKEKSAKEREELEDVELKKFIDFHSE